MKSINMKATLPPINNPVRFTLSGLEFCCLRAMLQEYRSMLESSDTVPDAVSKMQTVSRLLDRMSTTKEKGDL